MLKSIKLILGRAGREDESVVFSQEVRVKYSDMAEEVVGEEAHKQGKETEVSSC